MGIGILLFNPQVAMFACLRGWQGKLFDLKVFAAGANHATHFRLAI